MNKKFDIKKIFAWRPHKFWHWLIINLFLMGIVIVIIIFGFFMWLDYWTDHGEFVEVPEVKGLSYNMAAKRLESVGLQVELTDSIFDSDVQPGLVIEQNPKQGTKVKDGRTIYLVINAFSPKTVQVPALTDMSLRQTKSILEGLGIKNLTIHYVPSPHKDLVLSVKFHGVPVKAGTRLPITASLTIDVGEGDSEPEEIDIPGDSLDELILNTDDIDDFVNSPEDEMDNISSEEQDDDEAEQIYNDDLF